MKQKINNSILDILINRSEEVLDSDLDEEFLSHFKGINKKLLPLNELKDDYIFLENMKYYKLLYDYNYDIGSTLLYLRDINVISDSNYIYGLYKELLYNKELMEANAIYIKNYQWFFIGDMKKIKFINKYLLNKNKLLTGEKLLEAEELIDLTNKVGFDKIYLGLNIPDYLKIKDPELFIYYLSIENTTYYNKVKLYLDNKVKNNFNFHKISLSKNIIYDKKNYSIYYNDEQFILKKTKQHILLKIFLNNIGTKCEKDFIEKEFLKYGKKITKTNKQSVSEIIETTYYNIFKNNSKLKFMSEVLDNYMVIII